MRSWHIALAFVVLLSACSGGGEGGKTTVSEVLQSVEVVSRVSDIIVHSDTLLVGDLFTVRGDEQPTLTQYSCTGRRCATTNPGANPPVEPQLLDIATHTIFPGTEYDEIIRNYRGVGLSRHTLPARTIGGSDWTFENYGAWLEHSALDNFVGTAMAANIALQSAYSVSFGDATGSNPEGNATWTGVMIGNTRPQPQHPERRIQPLRGHATIGFNFGNNRLDIDFANIVNLATESAYPSFGFADVPVTNGVFPDPNRAFDLQNAAIAGRFYGPDHAEVGGVFTHSLGMGAFGARK